MYWTLELASKLEDAPWPATKDELIDYAQRSGAPLEVIENLQEIEEDSEIFESIEDIWPDYPQRRLFFNEDEMAKEIFRFTGNILGEAFADLWHSPVLKRSFFWRFVKGR